MVWKNKLICACACISLCVARVKRLRRMPWTPPLRVLLFCTFTVPHIKTTVHHEKVFVTILNLLLGLSNYKRIFYKFYVFANFSEKIIYAVTNVKCVCGIPRVGRSFLVKCSIRLRTSGPKFHSLTLRTLGHPASGPHTFTDTNKGFTSARGAYRSLPFTCVNICCHCLHWQACTCVMYRHRQVWR